ncbi:BgTH12-06861 [Blumeria graminis f. sp. triticale]|uniref:BgTH12-06861 n=1 Tax=Blumeria graminis f. sp. triticale TaxID=1689686 RepID=A0A9W4GHR2_BLUGR|nr:BgTH12-06861 [Blumeria graminis f. sp. triticale]
MKAALLQLIPEDVFYIVEDKSTAKEMWDFINDYFRPYEQSTINALLEDFWKFLMDEGTDVDIFVEELRKHQIKIASAESSMRTSDSLMKNRLLDHFDEYQSGHYSMAVTMLRHGTSITFAAAFNSPSASQTNYLRTHPDPVIAFASKREKISDSSPHCLATKVCTRCKWQGHICVTGCAPFD